MPRLMSILVALLVLASCASGPKLPLMSPRIGGQDWGYSERALTEQRMEVSYLGAKKRVSRFRSERDADAEKARIQSFDLALGRAAQLAMARNKRGFRVVDRHSDSEVTTSDYYDGNPTMGTGFGWGSGSGSSMGVGLGIPLGGGGGDSWLQARVVLTVEFLDTLKDGDYDAQDTLNQLERTYPTAFRV